MRNNLLLIIFVGVLSACSLNNASEATQPTATLASVAIVETLPSTSLPRDTPTTSPTQALQATTINTSRANNPCEPRPEWFTYTVASGDTLTSLAQLTDTTVEMLVEGNCLSDANTLIAGQQLLVPRPPLDTDAVNRQLIITPHVENRNGTLILQPGATVTIQWTDAPENSLVGFIEHHFLTDGGVRPIGDDANVGAEGASITYTVPDQIDGMIEASARLPGQNSDIIAATPLYFQTVGFADGDCRYVAPPLGGPHWVYVAADLNSSTLGEAQQEVEYTVNARTQGTDNGISIEFLEINFGGQIGYVPENNVPLRGNCAGLPSN